MIFDFHTHTTFSDGTLEPEELIAMAAKRGVNVISVTDHDSISNFQSVSSCCRRHNIELIKGVELSSVYEGKDVHILAYFYKEEDYAKLKDLEEIRTKSRVERVYKICEKLNELGIDIKVADVLAKSEKGSIGRPQIARTIMEKGYPMTFHEIFEEYLGGSGKAYVPSTNMDTLEMIRVVREFKGTPVLAHPGDRFYGNEEAINSFIDAGLQGIEAYYPSHSHEKISHYLNIARKKKLIATGGSDYHGTIKGKEDHLGRVRIPEAEYHRLKERMKLCSEG